MPLESLSTQDLEYVYERGVEDFFDHVLPAQSWEMPAKRKLPAKIGQCNKKLGGYNFDRRAKSS